MSTCALECAFVVAFDTKGGIGRDGILPWKMKDDMRRFKEITTHAPAGMMNAVIMGRKTWESLPQQNRPLQNRFNVVLTSRASKKHNVTEDNTAFCPSYDAIVHLLQSMPKIHKIFVIGGATVFEKVITQSTPLRCTKAYVTQLHGDYDCDVFFPIDDFMYHFVPSTALMHNATNKEYTFCEYVLKI